MRANSVREDLAGAHQVFADLKGAGIDFDDVTDTLERDGVASFAASFTNVLATLDTKRASL